jgi:hypothetical protein
MSDTMKTYIGCKAIQARPMDRKEFMGSFKGEEVADADDAPGYVVQYPDGYTSWSPKGVFEEAYRPVSQPEKTLIV